MADTKGIWLVRSVATLLAGVAVLSAAGCGGVIPLPVPETPAAAGAVPSPRPGPPPPPVTAEVPGTYGFCGHEDFARVATFAGHYSASDGGHYHGWLPPAGEVYWVKC
ncbi:MAG: hypothetical protein AB7J35_13500 [Dehalococcoidia bacterium]